MLHATTHNDALLSHFQELTAYHVWALTRIADWLRTKPGLLLENRASSSFPGIKATLLHMVEVEREWMGHLGVSHSLLQEGLEDELEAILDSLLEQGRLLQDYVGKLSTDALETECSWQLLLAGEMNLARKDILQHCINHSVYHRGQVVTIGHQLGLKDAPLTDYLFYCLKVKKPDLQTREQERGGSRVTDDTSRRPFLAINFFNR
ncbi:DinB family protein [Paraflavitalea pollutisoli]|uniref:DinB family protein n=1 Tax=Paraflavitalea pollutisoli TaxID=3034143 RepID=UPI0023EB920B|nr:DinB family protein [Paraflavitalea sp. H1-2-19X]